jgi:glutamine synthetase
MADRHSVMKLGMKEIAEGLGLSVTFMAKPFAEEAGSSCHIHLSLWRGEEAVFPGDTAFGPLRASDVFRWFLGGWMAHVNDLMVFFGPTVNSYKRYQPGSWAPVGIAWSYDNRTAGFRVVGEGSSLRIECRIPGADCNPYLAYAAVLAAGMDGVRNKIEPPAVFQGDVYQAKELPRVPPTLREAQRLFAGSDFAKQAFGEDVHEHYTHFFDEEATAYENAVTDWERWRYFERI